MIEISKESNPNYLCKVVEITNLRKHGNADRLQIAIIDFQDVITGLDTKEGDIYIYFPVESKINADFLSKTNSFRKKELNANPEKVGFFEEKCRVKAVKLRGEKSMGYIVPRDVVSSWAGLSPAVFENETNTEFDTINGQLLVEKYQVPVKSENTGKQGRKPRVSRLVDGQAHLHIDTENLRKNVHKLNPLDTISVTYKTHGTSWWVANVLVQRKLSLKDKIAKWFGAKVIRHEYDTLYGSRKVVKNKDFEDPKGKEHFYGYDLWEDIKNTVGEIPKGYSVYGECIGYTRDGGFIQGPYDYGCEVGFYKLEVYRVTHTTPDGLVTELSLVDRLEFCERLGLTHSHVFYHGYARGLASVVEGEEAKWGESLVQYLESNHNEKNCFMCINKVPEEGVVVRKESLFSCDSYKLKSFKFLEFETKELDKGEVNIEDQNE